MSSLFSIGRREAIGIGCVVCATGVGVYLNHRSKVRSLIKESRASGDGLQAAQKMEKANELLGNNPITAFETAELYEAAGKDATRHWKNVAQLSPNGLRKAVAYDRLAATCDNRQDAIRYYSAALSALTSPAQLQSFLDGKATDAERKHIRGEVANEIAKILHNIAAATDEPEAARRSLSMAHQLCDHSHQREDCHSKISVLDSAMNTATASNPTTKP